MTARSSLAAPAAPVAAAPHGNALWLNAFSTLSDDALVQHYRSRHGVRFEPVVDEVEAAPERIEALMHGDFHCNGEHHHLSDPIAWRHNPSADVEWHILLHKFHYAVGLGLAWQRSGQVRYVQRWCELISGWIDTTPAGFIAADVTGRRVQNWLYSLHALLFNGGTAPLPGSLLRRMLCSLHEQVEHLCTHLTPKRNHRTLELLAILLAGVALPEFKRAAHWREFALAQIAANLHADLLADGVHCELSTDYHHLALRNWLQARALAARNGLALPGGMDDALQRALNFSLHVHQPAGQVPSLSDGDVHSYLGLLREGAQLYGAADLLFVASAGQQGRAPAQRMALFETGGYHVVRSAWLAAPRHRLAQHLVFDCGPLGEGNHGHLDALSFELAAHGRALVVDPGRYTYSEAGAVNWRVHFRGTAAHNTVCVDGRNQTRYAPKPAAVGSRHAPGQLRHRISGPAPRTRLLEAASSARLDMLHGRAESHEYDAVHERVIAFIDQRFWIVSDSLRSPGVHHYAMRLQLHAGAHGATSLGHGNQALLRCPGLSIALPAVAGQRCVIEPAWVSARYGHKAPAPRLCCSAQGGDVDFDTVLLPWPHRAPALRIERQPVPGAAHALRIHHGARNAAWHTWFHARAPGTPRPAQAGLGAAMVSGVPFSGRWLLLRHAADGRLLHATTHAGAELALPPGVPLRRLSNLACQHATES